MGRDICLVIAHKLAAVVVAEAVVVGEEVAGAAVVDAVVAAIVINMLNCGYMLSGAILGLALPNLTKFQQHLP
jgi:hypothetical protein